MWLVAIVLDNAALHLLNSAYSNLTLNLAYSNLTLNLAYSNLTTHSTYCGNEVTAVRVVERGNRKFRESSLSIFFFKSAFKISSTHYKDYPP